MPREVGKFRHSVRKTARTDVVNGQNRIVLAARPTAVDHFLSAALHFGVASLHAVKVKRFSIRTRSHGTCGAATQTDAHTRAAEHDQERAGRQLELLGLIVADVADAARKHDGLVVAVAGVAHARFESAEVTENVGATEFIVKARGTDGALGHD